MKKIFALLLMITSMNVFAFQKQLSPKEVQEANMMESVRRSASQASEGRVHAPPMSMTQNINTMAGMMKQKAKKACFKEGTSILSADEGADCKAIEDVEVGDQVLSFDEASGEIVARRVEAIFRVYTDTLVEITFENGRVVETTEDHPFYSSESKDWIAAGVLQVGDFVSTNKGPLQIASLTIRELDEPLLVYDFSVESTHNYFVVGNGNCSATGFLVHNCNGPGANIPTRIDGGVFMVHDPVQIAEALENVADAAFLFTGGNPIIKTAKQQAKKVVKEKIKEAVQGAGIPRSSGPVFRTTKEATTKATELGFQKTSEQVNGQAVFKKGNEYITRDIDSHSGGAWKMAKNVKDLSKKETRSGTYDADLNRIGD